MKLFGFAGTAHSPSTTENIISQLSAEMEKKHIITGSVIESGRDNIIKSCCGCLNCYKNGKCALDETDEMYRLKKELLSSDIVVFGSPVYIHNVSASMKNYLDRHLIWMYTYFLAGKVAVTVSASSSNGNEYVNDYLAKVLKIMGANVVSNISCNIFDTPEMIHKKIELCCDQVSNALQTGITKPDPEQEKYFLLNKKLFSNTYFNGYLKDVWTNNNYFNSDSFMELYNSRLHTIKENR